MKREKPFICPSFRERISIKHALLLNSNTEVQCENCGKKLTPKELGKWYFAIGFFGVGLTGQTAFYWDWPVGTALVASLAVGVLLYIGAVLYAYKRVEFE